MQALHLFNLSVVLDGMNVIWSRSDPSAASIVHFWSKRLPIACIAEQYEDFNVVICALYMLLSLSQPNKGRQSSLHDMKQHMTYETLP